MRYLSLLILLAAAISAHCEQKARYEIFKVYGHISNVITGETLKKGDAVKPADRLNIDKDSRAGIIDNQQHRIYYSQKPGIHSVASIMRDAKRKADNAIAAVNSEALNQSKQASKPLQVNGVSYRGSETENAYLQSVCNAVLDISDIRPDDRLALKALSEDDAFYFSINNDTDSLLYVNVIAVRAESTPQLCLNIGMTDNQPYICIAPESQLTLPEFKFYDSNPADYYLLALSAPVDSQALSLLLSSGKRFEGVENAIIHVSPKITIKSDE